MSTPDVDRVDQARKPCEHCAGTGMDSTRHLDVVEDHPCGYCEDGTIPTTAEETD